MRLEDTDEVWASHHHTPLEALNLGWDVSDYVSVAVKNGEPLAMFGLVKRDILTGGGTVWLLGSENALKYKIDFLRQSRPLLREMLGICPRLSNKVHTKNYKSIEWLKWMGFTVSKNPEIYGKERQYFYNFFIEKEDLPHV
jgi:hypothetical protein